MIKKRVFREDVTKDLLYCDHCKKRIHLDDSYFELKFVHLGNAEEPTITHTHDKCFNEFNKANT